MRSAVWVGMVVAAMGSVVVSSKAFAGGAPLTTVRVASGVPNPLYVTHAPEDYTRVFIVEKQGRIRILNLPGNTLVATPFLDITAVVNDASSEQGLLGLAFHPNYAVNGFFYVNYTNAGDDTVVARYQVTANPNVANPASASILMTVIQPFTNHNGGWIDFSPNDGYLYIALGDGGSGGDPMGNGQNINTRLGKMLRIDVDGGAPFGIPPSNPFVGVAGDDAIWATGLRNPWRNAFDSQTGDLIIADVGQGTIEEVNFQPGTSAGGENYGWACWEGNNCFSGCCGAGFDQPIHTYTHGGVPFRCSITGGEIYRGCAIPEIDRTYFFADFCSNQIWSFQYNGVAVLNFQDRTVELDPPAFAIGNIASFGRDAYGEIYICDMGGGEVFKIVRNGSPPIDCNTNSVQDACDIRGGTSTDANLNGVPDECDGCSSAAECQDGLFCNGAEICDGLMTCQPGTAPNCDDGVACTIDACDEGLDACTHAPNHAACSDGLHCTGSETCDPIAGCQSGTPVDCDDGVACTDDSCDEAGDACVHPPNDGLCPSNNLFCDGSEFCDAADGCLSSGTTCGPNETCDEPTDTCIPGCMADEACDDGDLCTLDECDTFTCDHPPIFYGDINADGFVGVSDVLCILDTFAGIPNSAACAEGGNGPPISFEARDIYPCPSPGDPNNMGDGFVNVEEDLVILTVFQGTPLPCNPCMSAGASAAGGGPARAAANASNGFSGSIGVGAPPHPEVEHQRD